MYYNRGTAIAKGKQSQMFISLFNVFALSSLQKLTMVSRLFPIFSDHFAIPGLFQVSGHRV